MTMRMRVVHSTRYDYEAPVTYSYNEARLTPPTTTTQTALETAVHIEPPTSLLSYRDYWGTPVTAFDLHQPHDSLQVVATSMVETGTTAPAEGAASWTELRDDRVQDAYAELLAATPYTAFDGAMADAADAVAAQPTPADAVQTASALVREHLTYRPGATGVRTTAAEAWEARTGVCQDFAHITAALLRRAGVPARYVSGYLHPSPQPAVGLTAVGESHAWVEAWVGAWLAVDPTNGAPVHERHVLVGRGRDYRDVSPLRGIFAGQGRSTLTVSVAITRLH
ncbi:MAG TPA: transglutaminase family protein [Intrasporangium sp.]|uniref:transglutaminase family protein n=1 Tax=Intrasporangium sp. TaxID=1925024 RepID=UPI002D768311|nr:transglutaminase family protein [Intrasporangium sp.]HET7399691.1 transglutaminase family protein [Intrasporangium sp.]